MQDDTQPSEVGDRKPGSVFRAALGLVVLIAGGLFVVTMANAFAAEGDCEGGYTYGGYECADLTDRVLEIEPSTDLVDRQSVQLTGANFDPHRGSFGAAQCDALAVATDQIDACDLRTSVITSVDGNGDVAFPMTVRRIITTRGGGEIDCAVVGACVIGAGTLGGSLTTAIEGTSVPITFDPDVPPIPDLEIELTVDSITNDRATGTVTCSVRATFDVYINVRQVKGGKVGNAYGGSELSDECGVAPTTWSVDLRSGGSRRLVGGSATFEAYAYAYDGFSDASTEEAGQAHITGGPRPEFVEEEFEGEFTSVSIIGVVGQGVDQAIELEVTCTRPAEFGRAEVRLTQWAGLNQLNGYGSVPLAGCDGATRVRVPIRDGSGILAGGPTHVVASVYVEDYQPPDDYFFDYAATTDTVRLTGQIRPSSFVPAPDPNSRISITSVSKSAISGTVRCDEPVIVSLFGGGTQRAGRTLSSTSGYAEFECDGVTPFRVLIDPEFNGGKADVGVFAEAFTYDPYFEFLWSDQQSLAATVRNR